MNELGTYLIITLAIAGLFGGVIGYVIGNHNTGQEWNDYLIKYKEYVNNSCTCIDPTLMPVFSLNLTWRD
jgi:hypothetical protein